MQNKSLKNQAAVMIIVCEIDDHDQLLFTKRSQHLNTHGGEVAFPGGKWEPSDKSLLNTAYRETFEEVGLSQACLNLRGELPAHYTRNKVKVTPFAAHVKGLPELTLCEFEIESVFWAPTSFFLRDNRTQTDIFEFNNSEYWAPVYHYLDYKIWGFTARLLVTFLNKYYGASISRNHTAPEKLFSQ